MISTVCVPAVSVVTQVHQYCSICRDKPGYARLTRLAVADSDMAL